jgi:DNA-nicking Smr family endonuclease
VSKRKPPLPPPAGLDDEGRRLFEREYAGVRPLTPGPARIPLVPNADRAQGGSAERPGSARQRPRLHVERCDGRVTGAAAGVSRETVRALGRGEPPAEATCDLHGLRAEAARARLERFIEESASRGRRVVLIVCGRGLHSGVQGPVLLELTIETLAGSSACRHVLAFTSASRGQGGEGALRVLLRHRP